MSFGNIYGKYAEYKSFVREHPREVKRFEEMARMAVMLLPVSKLGVYSETINESIYASLANVNSFHEHIIHSKDPLVTMESNNKNGWMDSLKLRLQMLLAFVNNTEVAIEISFRQFFSSMVRERYIKLLEWWKVLVKLFLLFTRIKADGMKFEKQIYLTANGQYNPKQSHSVVQNPTTVLINQLPQVENSRETKMIDVDDNPTIEEIGEADDLPGMNNEEKKSENDAAVSQVLPRPAYWVGARTGKKYRLPENLKHRSNVPLSEVETVVPGKLNSIASKNGRSINAIKADVYLNLFGELLVIFRPVIYLHLSRILYSAKRTGFTAVINWVPWFTSLFMDLLSLRLSFVAIMSKDPTDSDKLTLLKVMQKKFYSFNIALKFSKEADIPSDQIRSELARRAMVLAFYFMRTPWYERYTLSLGKSIQSLVKKLPYTETLGGFVEDTLNYYQKTHFYISQS